MRTSLTAIGLAIALACPAVAAWNVTKGIDRMTDKAFAVASVSAPPGTLRVDCSGPDLTFAEPVAFGHMGVNYRFDNEELVPRIAPMSSDGRTVYLWLSTGPATSARIATAKRLRVEIFPLGLPRVFMDFDLTGAHAAVAALGCR
jgi:hypothetical protein